MPTNFADAMTLHAMQRDHHIVSVDEGRDEILDFLVEVGLIDEDEADEIEDNLADHALDDVQFGDEVEIHDSDFSFCFDSIDLGSPVFSVTIESNVDYGVVEIPGLGAYFYD